MEDAEPDLAQLGTLQTKLGVYGARISSIEARILAAQADLSTRLARLANLAGTLYRLVFNAVYEAATEEICAFLAPQSAPLQRRNVQTLEPG